MSPYKRHTPAEAVAALDQLGVALEEYRRRSDEIARDLAEAVHVALHAGATWGEVGARLDMSKQAARQHWGSYIQGMVAERGHQTRAAAGALAAGRQAPPDRQAPTGQPATGHSPATQAEPASRHPEPPEP
jgi:hypothetical protein